MNIDFILFFIFSLSELETRSLGFVNKRQSKIPCTVYPDSEILYYYKCMCFWCVVYYVCVFVDIGDLVLLTVPTLSPSVVLSSLFYETDLKIFLVFSLLSISQTLRNVIISTNLERENVISYAKSYFIFFKC